MKTAYSRVVWTMGLMGVSVGALAAEHTPAPPPEPAGFITCGGIAGVAQGRAAAGTAEVTGGRGKGIDGRGGGVAKSPGLKVRGDGYGDPRGTVDANLKLSEARANAVRDLFLAAGVDQEALEVNAYGKSQSVAADSDGYALERRVRLTLQAQGPAAVAQTGGSGLRNEGPAVVPRSG